jgi:hypothetical protein
MSALQTSLDDNAVDPGHWLVELVQKVQPHLSHLVIGPRQEPIIDTDGVETTAICRPIDKHYLMTTKGLARVDRTLFDRKAKPRLMSHHSIALIEGRAMVGVIAALEIMLEEQVKSYGKASVQ